MNQKYNIILSGHINSGKSTVANYLSKKYGYTKYALGDGVKSFISDLYRFLHILDNNIPTISLNDLYSREEKEKYRKHLQLLSTDLIRNYFGEDVWVNYLKNKIDKYPFVIDDIRFKNEYFTFKNFTKNVISIKIKGNNEKESTHISEHDVDDIKFDYEIENTNNLPELYSKIDEIINNINIINTN